MYVRDEFSGRDAVCEQGVRTRPKSAKLRARVGADGRMEGWKDGWVGTPQESVDQGRTRSRGQLRKEIIASV